MKRHGTETLFEGHVVLKQTSGSPWSLPVTSLDKANRPRGSKYHYTYIGPNVMQE